jgi:hypothetical protein
MQELFEPKVELRESDHKYFDKEGNEYLSFSALYGFLADEFDAKKVAYFAGGKTEQGMIEKLTEWDEKRNEGTRLDKALTEYAKTGKTEEKDLEDAVKVILEGYNKFSYEQLICYNEDYKIAGTIDKMCLSSNRKDSKFVISDFKGFEDVLNTDGTLKHAYDETLFVNRGWLKAPFGHLHKSKFTKISFQLSMYAFMIEGLTGKKCDGLFIHVIDPASCKGGKEIRDKRIPIPYLKNDVLILLETFKEQIKEKLTHKDEFVI